MVTLGRVKYNIYNPGARLRETHYADNKPKLFTKDAETWDPGT